MSAFHGLAEYHKARNERIETTKKCEEALQLLPEAKGHVSLKEMEQRLLLLLADTAEAQGDLWRAHEYDEKIKKAWFERGNTGIIGELATCYRREALEMLKAVK